jgi:putative nucleotidyltransferase-like protein
MMNLSNENRLLLYCARTNIPEATLDQVKNLINLPLKWEEVLNSAFWYGITPLLYHNLKGFQCIPQEVMDKLKEAYYGSMARNMYLYAELRRVLEAFHEKGVEVIVLKGAALAETIYGDIALRPMGDIDLLVKKENLSYAEKIMSESGYLFIGNKPPEWYRGNHYHIRYIHPEKNTRVEIHWHIANKSHPSQIAIIDTGIIERWWKKAQTIELFGKKTLVLCPDDLLFHLSLHFLKHRFLDPSGTFTSGFTSRGALIQICDIFQALKYYRDEINWTGLKYEAVKYGIDNLIYSTLYLAGVIMSDHDDTCHDVLCGFTQWGFDKELVRLIQKRIFIREDALPSSVFQSLVADTFQNKAKTLLREIFPHPEVLSKRYSVPLSSRRLYIYYLIHPFRILLKHASLISEIPRLKEEVILNKWISSKD